MARNRDNDNYRPRISDRVADDVLSARQSKRNRAEIREEGRERRLDASHQANLSLRNKVADVMLEDDYTRKAIIEGAKDTASFAKDALKWLGISLLIGGGTFAVYKIVKIVLDKYNQNAELDTQTKTLDKSNLTYPEDNYMLMANSMYTYFEPDAWSNFTQSINKSGIMEILKKLKTKDDWSYLLKCFGTKRDNPTDSNLTLIEFLRKDDMGDRKDYQKELDRIGAYNVLT